MPNSRTLIAMAAIAAAWSISPSHAEQPCPALAQPSLWPWHLSVMRHAGEAGPPQINQAARALAAGHRDEAVRLLTLANREPVDLRTQPPAYVLAIMDAGNTAWQLGGCSRPIASFRPRVVSYGDQLSR